jgi:hypothetical protein
MNSGAGEDWTIAQQQENQFLVDSEGERQLMAWWFKKGRRLSQIGKTQSISGNAPLQKWIVELLA